MPQSLTPDFLKKPPIQSKTPASKALAFQRDSEGGMTVLVLGLMVGVLGVSAVAVNSMHYESRRVAAQDALDRCSIMASLAQNRIDGGLSSGTTASAVATDCMNKSDVGSEGDVTPVLGGANGERTTTLTGNFEFMAVAHSSETADSQEFALSARARQRLPNLEISLALDMSNNPGFNSPNSNEFYRDLYIRFINTVAAPDTTNKVSFNIVPFAQNVAIPPSLAARFNTANQPPFAKTNMRPCMILPPSSKSTAAIDLNATYNWSWPVDINLPITLSSLTGADIDPTSPSKMGYSQFQAIGSGGTPVSSSLRSDDLHRLEGPGTNFNCREYTQNLVNVPLFGAQIQRPVTTAATTAINSRLYALQSIVPAFPNFSYNGNASEGMKWALAGLDPSLRPLLTAQVGDDTSPDAVAGRPLDYVPGSSTDTMKVLMLHTGSAFMAPGTGVLDPTAVNFNTLGTQSVREIKPEHLNDTLSPIWRTPEAETSTQGIRLSILHNNAPAPNQYWVTRDATVWGPAYSGAVGSIHGHWSPAPYQHPAGAAPIQLTWRQVFSQISVGTVIRLLYMDPMKSIGVLPGNSAFHFDTLLNHFTYIERTSAAMIANFRALCTEAKSRGVIIYVFLSRGVFNISGANNAVYNTHSAAARTAYQQCATSPAHVFNVTNRAGLSTALRLIASNIAQMTLK